MDSKGDVASNSSQQYTSRSSQGKRSKCRSSLVTPGWGKAMAEPRTLPVGIRDVLTGERVTVIEPANLYECTLGEDVFVGPYCEIQRGVTVGPRTRIQSHSFICELVIIGSDCFIGHGVMFINDLLRGGPAGGDSSR